jgi:hypothetical protein
MTTVGAGCADHEGADCAAPRLRAGKGRGKGARKGGQSGEDDTSSSASSTDESSAEASAAGSTPKWTRRLRQDDSDWSAFNDDISELSSES